MTSYGLSHGDMNDMPDGVAAEETYRPVSRLAVAAAIVGGLSFVAFVGPGLWFVPVVGTVLSVLAIRAMSQPGVELIGRGAATLGLALSVGVGCAAATSWGLSQTLAQARAVTVAKAWAGAIRGDRVLVARSMLDPQMQPAAMTTLGGNADMAQPIDDPDANERLFRTLPAVAAILGCGGQTVVDGAFHEFIPDSQERKEEWLVRLRLAPCAAQAERSLLVHLRRTMLRDAATWWGWQDHWSIIGFDVDG